MPEERVVEVHVTVRRIFSGFSRQCRGDRKRIGHRQQHFPAADAAAGLAVAVVALAVDTGVRGIPRQAVANVGADSSAATGMPVEGFPPIAILPAMKAGRDSFQPVPDIPRLVPRLLCPVRESSELTQ